MMAVIRVNKTGDYTVMSNTHFKEKEMSLKAKGLLSLMLSLPDNWDYSIAGLVSLSKDGKDSVMNALAELEEFGYLARTRMTDKQGRFAGYEYDIFENPQAEKPCAENPNTENPQQLNTKKSSTKKSSTKKIESERKRKRFVPPTLEEIEAYCRERKNNVNAKKFYDYFTASDWVDSKGKKVISWKQKIITWESYSNDNSKGATMGANGIAVKQGKTDLDDMF